LGGVQTPDTPTRGDLMSGLGGAVWYSPEVRSVIEDKLNAVLCDGGLLSSVVVGLL
jgi:hypothetical protein